MSKSQKKERIVLAGGCFWCTEAVFKMLRGVISIEPGYTGGTLPNPTYDQVCSGTTGHAEGIEIIYDQSLVRFEDLLTVFFGSHDSTTLNRQGNDVGAQYRSAVFYKTDAQKLAVERYIKEINDSAKAGGPVVTEILPLDVFYKAEDYHRDYFARNPGNPYCQVIINPKLEKVQEKFAELLNKDRSQK